MMGRTGGELLKSSEFADPVWAGVGGTPRNWYGCGAAVKYG
jgi:hypothetical protein